MYQRSNLWRKHIDFILWDVILLFLSLWMATTIRENLAAIFNWAIYREMLAVVLLMDWLYVAVFNPYSGILQRSRGREAYSILKQLMFIVAGFLFFCFATKRSQAYSRWGILLFMAFSFVSMFMFRSKYKESVQKAPSKRDFLLAADMKSALPIIRNLSQGFSVSGLILFNGSAKTIGGVPVVAENIDEAINYLETHSVDEILLADPEVASFYDELIRVCSLMGLTTHVLIKPIYLMGNEHLERIAGMDSITSCMRVVSNTELCVKRLMDILGSILGLLITAVLCIFVAPAIYISDPGPIFFKQPRVGWNGRIFYIYKFRTMYQDAEARKASLMDENELTGNVFKMKYDPRIIGSGRDGKRKGIGWFLRAFSIDEFPQFLNVLKGEMSMVGTRPPTLDEWEMYDYHHRQRMRTKPGITGLWQVSGRNEITDFEEIVKLDTKYIREWTLKKDIEILLKTIVVVISRKGSQ